jgi:tRNA-dihydrouridine synthase
MMDWTDVHFRHLCRLLTRRAVLYTEMVVDSTVNNCSQARAARAAARVRAQRLRVLRLGMR